MRSELENALSPANFQGMNRSDLDAVVDRPADLGDVTAEVLDATVIGDGPLPLHGLVEADAVLDDEQGQAVLIFRSRT